MDGYKNQIKEYSLSWFTISTVDTKTIHIDIKASHLNSSKNK